MPVTVREPASAPPSDQWEPSVASASTFSSNVTVIVSRDTATAETMAGGVMSAVVSTARSAKSASGFEDASRTKPAVCPYESTGASEARMVPESASVTVLPETDTDRTVGDEATPDSEKSPGAAELSETGSEIVRATVVPVAALAVVTTGASPSPTLRSSDSSWFVPSVTPPEPGRVYVRSRSGLVSGRLPESVRVMVSDAPAGSVLPVTVREPASALPSDQCEPSVASASTSPSNVTVMVSSEVATAELIRGGAMSAGSVDCPDCKACKQVGRCRRIPHIPGGRVVRKGFRASGQRA